MMSAEVAFAAVAFAAVAFAAVAFTMIAFRGRGAAEMENTLSRLDDHLPPVADSWARRSVEWICGAFGCPWPRCSH